MLSARSLLWSSVLLFCAATLYVSCVSIIGGDFSSYHVVMFSVAVCPWTVLHMYMLYRRVSVVAAIIVTWSTLAFVAELIAGDWGLQLVDHDASVYGPKILSVPILIVPMWIAVMYQGLLCANAILTGTLEAQTRTPLKTGLSAGVIAAFILLQYDLGADPTGVMLGWWKYPEGGLYHGVPVQNYAGWLVLTTEAIFLAHWWVWKLSPGAVTTTQPRSQSSILRLTEIVVFAASASQFGFNALPETLRMPMLLGCGLPFIIMIFRLLQHWDDPTNVHLIGSQVSRLIKID